MMNDGVAPRLSNVQRREVKTCVSLFRHPDFLAWTLDDGQKCVDMMKFSAVCVCNV